MYKPANRDRKMKIRNTPIPTRLVDTVTMDIFMMTTAVWEGNTYDLFVLIVDRHSGFTLTEPSKLKGFPRTKVANLVWSQWPDYLRVPSVITSPLLHFSMVDYDVCETWHTQCVFTGVSPSGKWKGRTYRA